MPNISTKSIHRILKIFTAPDLSFPFYRRKISRYDVDCRGSSRSQLTTQSGKTARQPNPHVSQPHGWLAYLRDNQWSDHHLSTAFSLHLCHASIKPRTPPQLPLIPEQSRNSTNHHGNYSGKIDYSSHTPASRGVRLAQAKCAPHRSVQTNCARASSPMFWSIGKQGFAYSGDVGARPCQLEGQPE